MRSCCRLTIRFHRHNQETRDPHRSLAAFGRLAISLDFGGGAHEVCLVLREGSGLRLSQLRHPGVGVARLPQREDTVHVAVVKEEYCKTKQKEDNTRRNRQRKNRVIRRRTRLEIGISRRRFCDGTAQRTAVIGSLEFMSLEEATRRWIGSSDIPFCMCIIEDSLKRKIGSVLQLTARFGFTRRSRNHVLPRSCTSH